MTEPENSTRDKETDLECYYNFDSVESRIENTKFSESLKTPDQIMTDDEDVQEERVKR